MTRKSGLSWICGLGAALLMTTAAHAQGQPPYGAGGPPPGFQGGPPGGVPGAAGQTADSNAISTTATTVTSTETTEFVDDASTLPNTGGQPLLMALAGSMLAGSAFFLRRRMS
jgi:LPXTG-motif cell wall-anchored protein